MKLRTINKIILALAVVVIGGSYTYNRILVGEGLSLSGTQTVNEIRTELDDDAHDFLVTGKAVKDALDELSLSSGNEFNAIIASVTADATVTGGRDTADGTDAAPGINSALSSAAAGQLVIVPAGIVLHTPISIIKNKRVNIIFLGDVYANKRNFLHFQKPDSGPYLQHRVEVWGTVWGEQNLPSHSKSNHDAGTGPDWAGMSGTAFTLEKVNQVHIKTNKIIGFAKAVEFLVGGGIGMQECTVTGRWWSLNAVNISMRSTDGNSYCDKNVISGPEGGTLRIGGGR